MTTSKQPKPTFIAKSREGYGKHANCERIGVAFANDGSVIVKLSGTQIVNSFMLYRIDEATVPADAAAE
jgi:hypothetical protein